MTTTETSSHESPLEHSDSVHPSSKRDTAVIEIPPKLPPFTRDAELVHESCADRSSNTDQDDPSQAHNGPTARLCLVLPACYTELTGFLEETITTTQLQDLRSYLQNDLDMSRCDRLQDYLWWASYHLFPVALHRYVLNNISIRLTEVAAEHLVIAGSLILFKPLPDYLLCHSVWDSYLCKDELLYASAIGLLRSYFHLVQSRGDFKIAQENSLIPTEISWQRWALFAQAALPNCHASYCNRRYRYGELSSERLTWIWRLHSKPFTILGLWDSYCQGSYNSSSNYIQEKTKWLLGALIYITIVLTAMQVGLGTERLSENRSFQRASYGFSVFSILAPLVVLLASLAMVSFRICLAEVYRLNEKKMPRN